MPESPFGRLAILGLLLVALVAAGGLLLQERIQAMLFGLTGEERLSSQLKGLTDLASDALRPGLNLAPYAPVRHTDINPFGVNVFLNEEVDPNKRERTVRLASDAGFHYLRQEFPWQDIEIHAKGDFEDRRTQPAKSAWAKYDQIVELAERYRMEVIVRVSSPPAWSRAAGEANGTFAPPDSNGDFGDFVSALVSRYRGRVRYYQVWNEPNIYPEWGNYAISPEDYTALLTTAATRARAADPNVVIICGALASTIQMRPEAPPPQNNLNDLLFLQRMYDAGAAPYFDVMAVQGYGLWSGPTDRRMQPRVINFGRPQFVRDLMVANGDANKPIWISEMAWNAVPDEIEDKRFGQVTREQQAAYAVLAYRRALQEWPWVGVINTWYFKRATDEWVTLGRPEAYFRLADPDFTLQPVYYSLKQFITGYRPVLYPGSHRPDGWGIRSQGSWQTVSAPDAGYGQTRQGAMSGARLQFTFAGSELAVAPVCGATRVVGQAGGSGAEGLRPPGKAQASSSPANTCLGSIRVTVDNLPPATIRPAVPLTQAATPGAEPAPAVIVARGLEPGSHQALVEVGEAPAGVAAFIVRGAPPPLDGRP